MIICVWCGDGKPTDLNDFLLPFVSELNNLLQNGVQINEFQLNILVRCFICDTPARSFIKGKLQLF